VTEALDFDRAFALTHVPHDAKPAIEALFALDARLGTIVATTTQPMVGQMRMTWWHEAVSGLKAGDERGEPVLDALAAHILGHAGIDGAALAGLIDGWEVLLDPLPLGENVLATYADARGGTLFSLVARVLGKPIDVVAGRGWALADFAWHCSDAATATRARMMANDMLTSARMSDLPRPLRALARLARADVRHGAPERRSFWRLSASIR
jgi:phytoene synthase